MERRRTNKNKVTFRRKTSKSGEAKSTVLSTAKFNAIAHPLIPSYASENNINKLSSKMESVTINNGKDANYMPLFASQWVKIKEKVENAVAIDCEMVGVGPYNKSALAHVAIVDFNGKKIYDKYVIPSEGIESITDYRTDYSGITPIKLVSLNKTKHSFEIIRREVHKILKDKIIIGHGLINDFKVLNYTPVKNMVWDTTLIDTYLQNHPYIPDKRQPRKLKAISKEFANNNIQKEDKTGHSPLEDARASMNLYRIAFLYPKIVYTNMSL
jgi:hypothetical protein